MSALHDALAATDEFGSIVSALHDASPALSALVRLSTFNKQDRALINANPVLRAIIRSAETHEFAGILQNWRLTEAARIRERVGPTNDVQGMRAQALHDMSAVAAAYAALADGRRTGLFSAVCKVAKYVSHDFITEQELRTSFMDAARANGAIAKHGVSWAVITIRQAINRAANDPLPPLARKFRSEGQS